MKNIKTLAAATFFGLAGLVFSGCGESQKCSHDQSLKLYLHNEDSIFQSLASSYKEEIKKLMLCKNEMEDCYDLSEFTKENNKGNHKEVYEGRLRMVEIHDELRETNKRLYLK